MMFSSPSRLKGSRPAISSLLGDGKYAISLFFFAEGNAKFFQLGFVVRSVAII